MSKKNVYVDYGDGMYCQEVYWSNGELMWKGIHVNGERYGYFEWYNDDGSIDEDETCYFLKNELVSDTNDKGYCLIWRKEVIG